MAFEMSVLKFDNKKTKSAPRKTTEFRKQGILNDEKKLQSDRYLEETTTVRHKTAHHREFES